MSSFFSKIFNVAIIFGLLTHFAAANERCTIDVTVDRSDTKRNFSTPGADGTGRSQDVVKVYDVKARLTTTGNPISGVTTKVYIVGCFVSKRESKSSGGTHDYGKNQDNFRIMKVIESKEPFVLSQQKTTYLDLGQVEFNAGVTKTEKSQWTNEYIYVGSVSEVYAQNRLIVKKVVGGPLVERAVKAGIAVAKQ